jgi:hypothetical protein
MPRTLAQHVQDPLGAQAAIFCLLLDPGDAVRQRQLDWVRRYVHPAVVRLMQTVVNEAQRLPPEARLPLVELAVPALRQMSRAQVHDFLAGVNTLVEADHKLTLFEYALQRLLLRHLVAYFLERTPPPPRYTTFAPLVKPTEVVLSALARAGESTPDRAGRAFAAGVQSLEWPGVRMELSPQETTDLMQLDAALKTLDAASRPLKKQILLACAACVGLDGRVTVEEGELLRAISDSIDCPMPPLIGVAASNVRAEELVLNHQPADPS